jgi:hypothetical protein
MKIRFLQNVQLKKINNDGSSSIFAESINKHCIVTKLIETEDPNYIDVYLEDGYIKDLNRSVISVINGSILPYEKPIEEEIIDEDDIDE